MVKNRFFEVKSSCLCPGSGSRPHSSTALRLYCTIRPWASQMQVAIGNRSRIAPEAFSSCSSDDAESGRCPCLPQHFTLLPAPFQTAGGSIAIERGRGTRLPNKQALRPARLSPQEFVLKDSTSTSAA